MPLIIVALGIVILLFLMTYLKLNAFFSLLITSFLVGFFNAMGVDEVLHSILKGIGDTMGGLILILVFGAMLGKLIEDSGAALAIILRLNKVFGEKKIQLAVIITGFLVGLPMVYNASFLVLIPLIYAFASTSKKNLLYLGIPLSASLSVAHAYLPPHPAPVAVSLMYGADINLTLLYGLIPCIPAIFLAGPVLSRFFTKQFVVPPKEFYEPKEYKVEELPGLGVSLLTALSPVFLMLVGAVLTFVLKGDEQTGLTRFTKFASDPNFALFAAVCIGIFTLGIRRGKKMPEIMKSLEKSVASIAMVVLIIAGGGALKQVLFDSGVAEYIKTIAVGLDFNPIIMAWVVAALLRLAIGSATVATITAAGIMLPIVAASGVRPELMVLATGSGSLMFSHFNDIGFWMFKEYYNVSIKQTFQIWTVMESIVAVVGLIAVLILHAVL